MDHQKILSLDEDSINFIKKHHELLRKDYPSSYCSNNVRISLDDLINEKEFQINIARLMNSKAGLTHLKLLLSISSKKDIKDFYKKFQAEKIIDIENKEKRAIREIAHQYLFASKIKIHKYSPKVDLDSLKCLKQIMYDNLGKNFELLSKSKEEFRYYEEKVDIMSDSLNERLISKAKVENDVARIKEENKRVEFFKKSLLIRKNKLRYLQKRINLYTNYFGLLPNGKTNNLKNKLLRKSTTSEKETFRQLLDSFKKQKFEANKILAKIPREKGDNKEVYKRYSDLTEGISLSEDCLKKEKTYKKSLAKEIKYFTKKTKFQISELKCLNKIIDLYYEFETSILEKIDCTKNSLEIQKKLLNKYKENNDNQTCFEYDNNPGDEMSEIKDEVDKLYSELDVTQRHNQKIFRRAIKMTKLMVQGKKRFEKIKRELSDQIPLTRAMIVKMELYENGLLLKKLKIGFDKLEIDFNRARAAKDTRLILLRELGERHQSFITKLQISLEFFKENVLVNENILTDFYEKLIALRIELATNFELFETSCLNNDKFPKTIQNIYSDIAKILKEIWHKVHSARESFEKKENYLNLQLNEQKVILKKYKKFYDKYKKLFLEREDIEILIYQNASFETKLDGIYYQKSQKYELRRVAFGFLHFITNVHSVLRKRLKSSLSFKDKLDFITPLFKIETFSMLQTGIVVFLILSCFSYFLINKGMNSYDNRNSFFTSHITPMNYDKRATEYNKKSANMVEFQSKEKKNPFGGNNFEKLSEPLVKTASFNSNQLTVILEPKQPKVAEDIPEAKMLNPIWGNYIDIFDDLRFDNPKNAFRLFELIMNREVIDLSLMDSIQLLYSIKRILESEEGPFFDRLFHDFVALGLRKKETVLNIIDTNKVIEEIYGQNLHFIFKGKIRPIAILEEMDLKSFEEIILPYIIINYKTFAKVKNRSVPKNLKTYAKNLAQDIYICAKKFRVPVTSLLTIVHQETFFINMLGDQGKSASPFQIYQPTKHFILANMKKDGFKVPAKVPNLENHTTFAAFMASYYFANLIRQYAVTVIEPFSRKPTALIINLEKSTRAYNGGKKYQNDVYRKQLELGKYLKRKIKKGFIAS